MSDKDPFIERLAKHRGISYEAAVEEHRSAQLLEDTEFIMITCRKPLQLAPPAPTFGVGPGPAPTPEKDPVMPPALVRGWMDTFFGRRRPLSPAEAEQRLIDETESKMMGPPLQSLLNRAAGIDPHAAPVAVLFLAPPAKDKKDHRE